MASIRDKVRDMTTPSRVGLDLGVVVEQLNPVLRGWGAYFRQGNSSAKFGAIDYYVHERGAVLAKTWALRVQLGRPLHVGLARESWDLPTQRNSALPDCACITVNDVGEPCAGEPHARFDRGALATRDGVGGTQHPASGLADRRAPNAMVVS